MKCIAAIGVALLACVATLAPNEIRAQAQGRGVAAKKPVEPVQQVPITPEERARQLAEMEVWLRRLVGKYRMVSTWLEPPVLDHCIPLSAGPSGRNCAFPRPNRIFRSAQRGEPKKGSVECEDFAAGPGVSCRMTWLNLTEVFLFGLDPGTPGISLLWARGGGVTILAQGSPRDDTVAFHTGECPWITREFRGIEPCIPIVLIRANSDAKSIELVGQSVVGGVGWIYEWDRINEVNR